MKDSDLLDITAGVILALLCIILIMLGVILLSYISAKNSDLKYNIRNISIECPYCKNTDKLKNWSNTENLNFKCKFPSLYGPKTSYTYCTECGKKVKVEINEYFNLIPRRINE